MLGRPPSQAAKLPSCSALWHRPGRGRRNARQATVAGRETPVLFSFMAPTWPGTAKRSAGHRRRPRNSRPVQLYGTDLAGDGEMLSRPPSQAAKLPSCSALWHRPGRGRRNAQQATVEGRETPVLFSFMAPTWPGTAKCSAGHRRRPRNSRPVQLYGTDLAGDGETLGRPPSQAAKLPPLPSLVARTHREDGEALLGIPSRHPHCAQRHAGNSDGSFAPLRRAMLASPPGGGVNTGAPDPLRPDRSAPGSPCGSRRSRCRCPERAKTMAANLFAAGVTGGKV